MTQSPEILIIDDDAELIRIIKAVLKKVELEPRTAATGRLALQEIQDHSPSVVLLDLQLPDMSGMEILRQIKQSGKPTTVIVMTAHGSMEGAVEAMREGAYDFLTKPLDFERVRVMVRNAQERHRLIEQLENFRSETELTQFHELMGSSPLMKRLYQRIQDHHNSTAPVLILGTPGSEFANCAKTVHAESPLRHLKFVEVNCRTLNEEGIVEAFAKTLEGTLYFSNLHELGEKAQLALFSELSNSQSSARRVISSAFPRIKKAAESGTFHKELFLQLSTVGLQLPRLRERGDDLIEIAKVILQEKNRTAEKSFREFSDEAETAFFAYDWPRNLEELEEVIGAIVEQFSGTTVRLSMLPSIVKSYFDQSTPPVDSAGRGISVQGVLKPLWVVEKEAIQKALSITEGNIIQAAILLEISPATIYRKQRFWEANQPR